MSFSMFIFFLIFFGVVLFSFLLFLEIRNAERKAIRSGYGPQAQVNGKPCAEGKITCLGVTGGKINRSLSFEYDFFLYRDGANYSAKYSYQYRDALHADTSYNGESYFFFGKRRVKGRSMMAGMRTVEGQAGPNGVRLIRGYPKQSFFKVFNGPYEYSCRNGLIRFDNTTRAGNISDQSNLRAEKGHISGRVFHGPQKTWAVDVDVSFSAVAEEVATLAVVLACDDILRIHHSD